MVNRIQQSEKREKRKGAGVTLEEGVIQPQSPQRSQRIF